MPQGAAITEGSSGEMVSHYAAVRVRVNGTGALQMKVSSLDDIRTKNLVAFAMTPTARYSPTRLVNFMEQRASFEFKTTEMDEKFRINRIIVFSKAIFTSYPGS